MIPVSVVVYLSVDGDLFRKKRDYLLYEQHAPFIFLPQNERHRINLPRIRFTLWTYKMETAAERERGGGREREREREKISGFLKKMS